MSSAHSGLVQDHITVIASTTRARMTKVFGPGEAVISTAKPGTEFLVYERQVGGLADIYALLVEIASQQDRAVIRDRLKPGLSHDAHHRRNRQTFDQVAHHWLMVDCDGIDAPPGMCPTDPHAVECLVQNHLPIEFHAASYIIQFSSSAGTVKAGRKIKVHLWFWMATPAHSDTLVSWAEGCGVDPSVYRPVQVHYTADPIFRRCADPLPGARILLVQKAREAVALAFQGAPGRLPKGVPAASAPAMVGECGTLVEGREAWLLAWNMAYVRDTLTAGLPLDADRMTEAACAAFHAHCSNADGTWPPARIAEKVASTVQRAERGDIPGLPRMGLSPHWNLIPESIEDVRAALDRHVAEFFRG